jgi:hypothetical protein
MALSGSANYALTRDEIITAALRKTNTIGTGETPETALVTEVAGALNRVVKALAADGMPLWRIATLTITPVAGTATYNIGEGQTVNVSAPLRVLHGYRRITDSNGDAIDVPLRLMTKTDYDMLPNKTLDGTPVAFVYVTPGANVATQAAGQATFWPRPDANFISGSGTGELRLTYHRQFDDLDAAGDHLDFPSYWYQAVVWALADEISAEQGVPLGERSMIHRRAQEERIIALGFNPEEGSIRFVPDSQYLESTKGY